MNVEQACESTSPIYPGDVAPRRCQLSRGHEGLHRARTSDGAEVSPQYDYTVEWTDALTDGQEP